MGRKAPTEARSRMGAGPSQEEAFTPMSLGQRVEGPGHGTVCALPSCAQVGAKGQRECRTLAWILITRVQHTSHLFSKIDDVHIDFLFLKTLRQLHQLQGDTAASAADCPQFSYRHLSSSGARQQLPGCAPRDTKPRISLKPSQPRATLPARGSVMHPPCGGTEPCSQHRAGNKREI